MFAEGFLLPNGNGNGTNLDTNGTNHDTNLSTNGTNHDTNLGTNGTNHDTNLGTNHDTNLGTNGTNLGINGTNQNVADAKNIEIILEAIQANPAITLDKLSELTSLSRRTITRTVKAMQEAGIIKRIGSTRGRWEIIN